jgi:2-polyprenyl-6-methoxyphenol hydroxylase-like FAD-dependent oxidoreductase
VLIGHGDALAPLQHSPEPILWECLEVAREEGLAVSACTLLRALPCQIGSSLMDSDTALASVLSSLTRLRKPLHAVAPRVTTVGRAAQTVSYVAGSFLSRGDLHGKHAPSHCR